MTVDNLDDYATSLLDVRSKVAYLKGYEKGLAKGKELAVKHGHWMESKCLDDCFWVCSCCKFPSQAIAANKLYVYCPNCGAMMDGDVNETD